MKIIDCYHSKCPAEKMDLCYSPWATKAYVNAHTRQENSPNAPQHPPS